MTSKKIVSLVLFAVSVVVFVVSPPPVTAQNRSAGVTPPKPDFQYHVYLPLGMRPWQVVAVWTRLRYDFVGWIRGSEWNDVRGWDAAYFDYAVSADVLRAQWSRGYSQNPYSWPNENWTSYFSLSQWRWVSSSLAADPAWKWREPMFISSDWQLANGAQVLVDGQPFRVAGPFDGYTAFGIPYRYWRLNNMQTFLFWDIGSSVRQYVVAGDVELHYDAGRSRIRTTSSVRRTDYVNGSPDGDTVQYVEHLTEYISGPVAWPAKDDPFISTPAGAVSELAAPDSRMLLH